MAGSIEKNASAMIDKRQFFAVENKISGENCELASKKIIAGEKSADLACPSVEHVEPIASTTPAQPRSPHDPHPENFLAEQIPCPACQCSMFWESLYFDGQVHCWKCDPPPGLEFIGRKIARNETTDVASGEVFAVEWEQRIWEGGKPAPRPAMRRAATTTSEPTLPALGGAGGEGAAGDVTGDMGEDDDNDADNSRYDRFVEFRTVDGRRCYALRGWDNPKSPNFNLRLVQAAGIGWEAADRLLDDAQAELRAEMFG